MAPGRMAVRGLLLSSRVVTFANVSKPAPGRPARRFADKSTKTNFGRFEKAFGAHVFSMEPEIRSLASEFNLVPKAFAIRDVIGFLDRSRASSWRKFANHAEFTWLSLLPDKSRDEMFLGNAVPFRLAEVILQPTMAK